jgi:micrococcal nuclease
MKKNLTTNVWGYYNIFESLTKSWPPVFKVGLGAICILIFLVITLGANFGSNPANQTKPIAPESNRDVPNTNILVRSVLDGDTIQLEDGRKVRFLNMDTPETVKRNYPVMCYGPEASTFVKTMLSDKKVTIVFDKETVDQYDRTLAFVFLAGTDTSNIENSINAQMLKLGYARENSYSPNTTYRKKFKELEALAKTNRIGFWGKCDAKNPSYRITKDGQQLTIPE